MQINHIIYRSVFFLPVAVMAIIRRTRRKGGLPTCSILIRLTCLLETRVKGSEEKSIDFLRNGTVHAVGKQRTLCTARVFTLMLFT